MTIKSADDAVVTETMADRLRGVQLEPWRRLRCTDENDEAAWDVYAESLFLPGHGPQAEGGGGAKGRATGAEDADAAAGAQMQMPRLESAWTEDKLLRAVSGMADGRPGETRRVGGNKCKEEEVGAAAAAAAAVRGRGGTTSGSAMELD